MTTGDPWCPIHGFLPCSCGASTLVMLPFTIGVDPGRSHAVDGAFPAGDDSQALPGLPGPGYVRFAKLHPGAKIPTRATPGSAGLDLHMLLTRGYPLFFRPGERHLVRTGLQAIIPPGYEGQVRPRSGLACRGVTVLNAPGTIDADYRGELQVLLINLSEASVELDPDERIAQLVVAPVAALEVLEVEPQPEDTERTGGFGSTGRT